MREYFFSLCAKTTRLQRIEMLVKPALLGIQKNRYIWHGEDCLFQIFDFVPEAQRRCIEFQNYNENKNKTNILQSTI